MASRFRGSHLVFSVLVGGLAACSSATERTTDGDSADTAASPATKGVPKGDLVPPSDSCHNSAGCIRSELIQVLDSLEYFQTALDVKYSGQPKYLAYRFDGVAGDTPDINVLAFDGSDPELWILDSEFGIVAFNDNRDSSTKESRLDAKLPPSGSQKFFIAFREKHGRRATFDVGLTGKAGDIEPIDYPSSRIAQADIDKGVYTADQLFAFSDFTFDHEFTVDEGLGNALSPPLAGPNPRPNSRRIHNGKFGGPDATSCIQCHHVGGNDGGGTLDDNLLQDGDGVNLSSVLVRNPPALLGAGYVQQLGLEMTAELQAQLAAAKSAGGGSVDLATKGVRFGTVTVATDGSVDFSHLEGVDKDLVVKPFGWKGRTAVLRRFVEGGFQVHLGMATQALVAQNCKTPIPNVIGNGPDCTDPDNDGVRDEILEGQLTAMALYPTLLQVPIRGTAANPSRAQNGEQLFNQVGCASCHVQRLVLKSPVHVEKPDLSGGPGFVTNLTVDGRRPRLAPETDGSVVVELWSDLKRHDMGATLADPHDTFGGAVAARQFMTRPLWGVGASPPYLHDGRAATLQDAIAQHDGEGAAARDAFLALDPDAQAQVTEFLQTLNRDPRHNDD